MSEQEPTVEVLDGEPVQEGVLEPLRHPGALEVSNRQVAALAASGFVAGAAAMTVIGRRGARRARRRRRKGLIGEVVSSSSFLVDVHVLKR